MSKNAGLMGVIANELVAWCESLAHDLQFEAERLRKKDRQKNYRLHVLNPRGIVQGRGATIDTRMAELATLVRVEVSDE